MQAKHHDKKHGDVQFNECDLEPLSTRNLRMKRMSGILKLTSRWNSALGNKHIGCLYLITEKCILCFIFHC